MSARILAALEAVAHGQRPDVRDDWFLLALGGDYDHEGGLRAPLWRSRQTLDCAAALLLYARAALAESIDGLSAREIKALRELDDTPLDSSVAFLLYALDLAELEPEGAHIRNEVRDRWAGLVDALDAQASA